MNAYVLYCDPERSRATRVLVSLLRPLLPNTAHQEISIAYSGAPNLFTALGGWIDLVAEVHQPAASAAARHQPQTPSRSAIRANLLVLRKLAKAPDAATGMPAE